MGDSGSWKDTLARPGGHEHREREDLLGDNLVLLPRYGDGLETPSSYNPQRPQDFSYHTK